MEETYNNALLSLEELESQKNKIDFISKVNNNIYNNIYISNNILISFNSLFSKMKLKLGYKLQDTEINSENIDEEDISNKTSINLNDIIIVNKKINEELNEQNMKLKTLKQNIHTNNYIFKEINNKFKPLLND